MTTLRYYIPSAVGPNHNEYTEVAVPFHEALYAAGFEYETIRTCTWREDCYEPLTPAAELWLDMNLPVGGRREEVVE